MQPGSDLFKHLLMQDTPVGSLLLSASAEGITALTFLPAGAEPPDLVEQSPRQQQTDGSLLQEAASQLRDYFAGKRKAFNLPLDLSTLPLFTRAVLEQARSISRGEVVSYGAMARLLGKPGAARAVGGAMARNPIPIIIPCHRVVASDGRLHGYSSPGGIALKELLLQLEGVQVEAGRVI